MVQNINASNSVGNLSRIGTANNGRVVFEINAGPERGQAKLSVAQKDADVFEKTYNDMITSAQKLQSYAQKMTPEKLESQKKKANWSVGLLTFAGGIIPAIKAKGKSRKQILWTIGGTALGFATGLFTSSMLFTPPGAAKLNEASKTLSKLDIQPVIE